MEQPECPCDDFDASILHGPGLLHPLPYCQHDSLFLYCHLLVTCPPPPPPQGPSTPQRFSTTSPKSSHSTFGIQDQSRLPRPALRNSSYDELETGRRLPRHPEGEWPRLPVHYSLQQIQPVQGHRGDGPCTSTPVEVPLPRIEQQLASSHSLWPRHLCPALRQHRYDRLCG